MKKDKIVELEHIAELEHSTLYSEHNVILIDFYGIKFLL